MDLASVQASVQASVRVCTRTNWHGDYGRMHARVHVLGLCKLVVMYLADVQSKSLTLL